MSLACTTKCGDCGTRVLMYCRSSTATVRFQRGAIGYITADVVVQNCAKVVMHCTVHTWHTEAVLHEM